MKNIITSSLLIYVFGWLAIRLEQAIMPFFIAGLIAYILSPLVNYIAAKLNINRIFIITFVVLLILLSIVGLCMIFVPLVSKQISLLISRIPGYKEYIQHDILPDLIKKMDNLSPDFVDKFNHAIDNLLGNAAQSVTNMVNYLFDYTSSLASLFTLLFFMPILLFYFLRDWPKKAITINIFGKNVDNRIKKFFSDIDILLSAYMRGQLKVCIIMAIYYSIALSIVGVDLALLIGVISGFVIILPFIGFLFAMIIALIFGYFEFGFTAHLFYILMIYLTGSVLEGSIFTPKIVGDKIGIHPLWIIFAVLACGQLLGIMGMLFAIPIAGVTKIVLELILDLYKTKNKKNAAI